MHIQGRTGTHKHTCIISTQEELRQPGVGAWLRGAEERLLLETKALCTHKKGGKKERKMSENPDIHDSKENNSSTQSFQQSY